MRIFLTLPRRSGNVHIGAVVSWASASKGAHTLIKDSPQISLLSACFNKAWASAITRYGRGEIDCFAMIHSDIEAPAGWLDTLVAEMDAHGLDAISAVVPIKDQGGLTSTAVDDTGDPWEVRRLTMAQVHKLPVTFTEKDVGPILLNTGLWVVKLGPWCLEQNEDGTLKHRFTILDCIRMYGDEYAFRVIPEDWDFSRQMRAAGLKLGATRAVVVKHFGEAFYANNQVWGKEEDDPPTEFVPEAVSEIVKEAAKIPGWMTLPELAWLSKTAAALPSGASWLEVGAWCGRSTYAVGCSLPVNAGLVVVDKWTDYELPQYLANLPDGDSQGPRKRFGEMWTRLDGERPDIAGEIWVSDFGAVATSIPGRFDAIFIDADHSYEAVKRDCRLAERLLKQGGLLCGHDFAPSDPGVMQAVRELYPNRFTVAEGTSIWSVRL